MLHGSFYLGRPGPQLYHRYVIPAQPLATGKSNYSLTHFNASLSTQLVSCSGGLFFFFFCPGKHGCTQHSTPPIMCPVEADDRWCSSLKLCVNAEHQHQARQKAFNFLIVGPHFQAALSLLDNELVTHISCRVTSCTIGAKLVFLEPIWGQNI